MKLFALLPILSFGQDDAGDGEKFLELSDIDTLSSLQDYGFDDSAYNDGVTGGSEVASSSGPGSSGSDMRDFGGSDTTDTGCFTCDDANFADCFTNGVWEICDPNIYLQEHESDNGRCELEVRMRFGAVYKIKSGCKQTSACDAQETQNFSPGAPPSMNQCKPHALLQTGRFGQLHGGESVCRTCMRRCPNDDGTGLTNAPNPTYCFGASGIPVGDGSFVQVDPASADSRFFGTNAVQSDATSLWQEDAAIAIQVGGEFA